MKYISQTGNKILGFFNTTGDLIILNILFLISCIPVVTISASLKALYTVTLCIADHTESYIIRSYFRAWKQNIRKHTAIGCVSLILFFLCVLNLRILPAMPQNAFRLCILCFQFFILFMLYGILLYSSISGENSDISLKQMFKRSLYLTFKHLPLTLLCLCITLIPITLIIVLPKTGGYILPLMLVLGFSLIAYAHAFILRKSEIVEFDSLQNAL